MKKRVLAVVLFLTTMVTCSFAFSNIAGPSSICQGKTATYTSMMPEGMDVTWYVSGNATIVSGQGTTEIQVKFYGYGTVTISNNCEIGGNSSKTVKVQSYPTVKIKQRWEFFSDTKLTFQANVTPYSTGTYTWNCDNNPIEYQNNSKVNITMNSPEPVMCTFTNTCGSDSDILWPKDFIIPF
jgi:hypothetical protein